MKIGNAVRLTLLLLASVAIPLQAQYLDPGTGSYILQILLAVGLASIFYFKQIFAFTKAFISKMHKRFFPDDKGK
jgi:hypothetical protein